MFGRSIPSRVFFDLIVFADMKEISCHWTGRSLAQGNSEVPFPLANSAWMYECSVQKRTEVA